MIPRLQRVVYWILLGSIALMAILLVFSRYRDHERILAMRDQSPIAAPSDIPNEEVSIAIPNDADGSIALDSRSLALPPDPSSRARVLLVRLFADLSAPSSSHPVPAGPAVTDVFFLALPLRNPGAPVTDEFRPANASTGMQLAVVNLTETFADQHPSGIETEDLTLRAAVATLHANFPEITAVRFLVDGKPRDTLNGHSSLLRPYAVVDPVKSIHTTLPGSE